MATFMKALLLVPESTAVSWLTLFDIQNFDYYPGLIVTISRNIIIIPKLKIAVSNASYPI
jgi:hypothetical protein